jgi:diguanylate cyclase (GGDEF)-like protein
MMNDFNSTETALHLADTLADAFALFNLHGRLLYWSESMSEFFPTASEALSTELTVAGFMTHLNADLQQPLAIDTDVNGCQLRNGKSVDIRFIRPVDTGLVITCRDVSSIKREQEALLASDLKFRQFATLASNWFWELDEHLCYKYHSSHCQPLAGANPDSLVGQPRIIKLDGMVVDNEQLHEHNRCLQAHEDVDVVLTWVREDGQKIYSRILAKPQYQSGRFVGYIGCGRDVTAAHELREMLKYQAEHDDLTGLLNRRAFAELLNKAFAQQSDTQSYALIKFDLDHFKLVNDEAGHQAGDALLVEVTGLLQRETHHSAVIARLGGDEFGIYMQATSNAAQHYADRIIQHIDSHRFEWRDRRFAVGASAGIAFLDDSTSSATAVLKNADAACYSAKRLGRNRALLFSPDNYFQQQQNQERRKVAILQSAIDNDRLKLYLQPIVPAGAFEGTVKYEVLLRIVDENDQIIAPGELIPVAEKFDLIQLIDMHVVQKAITLLQCFLEQQFDVNFSVNLSGNTLSNNTCLRRIASLVRASELPDGALGFEITETSAIESIDQVSAFITQMRDMGCLFSIDDFGSGLSSYNYLNSLHADYLKIDGSFVSKILTDQTSFAIVKSINTLSHEMGMKTVAEFVEHDAVADTLRLINIDYLQGYLFGQPQRAEDILEQYQQLRRDTGT